MDWIRAVVLLDAFRQGGEANRSTTAVEQREAFVARTGTDTEALAWFDEGFSWREEPNP